MNLHLSDAKTTLEAVIIHKSERKPWSLQGQRTIVAKSGFRLCLSSQKKVMETSTIHYPNVTACLGPAATRYFAGGHKHFHWEVSEFIAGRDRLDGRIAIRYEGPPRPGAAAVHIGSIEYAALAGMISEYALAHLLNLMPDQISRSWVRRMRIKVTRTIDMETRTEVPFSCRYLGTELTLDAFNVDVSRLEIRIGTATVDVELDHVGNIFHNVVPEKEWPVNIRAMHNHGYRLRTCILEHVCVDTACQLCSASVRLVDGFVTSYGGTGLSAARSQLMPTDVLSITGQLMQVLLYKSEGRSRDEFPNIWLREADIHVGRPVWITPETALVRFLAHDTLKLGDSLWKTIRLESTIGNIHGRFCIAHQITS